MKNKKIDNAGFDETLCGLSDDEKIFLGEIFILRKLDKVDKLQAMICK